MQVLVIAVVSPGGGNLPRARGDISEGLRVITIVRAEGAVSKGALNALLQPNSV